MWIVANRTRYACDGLFLRNTDGAEVWVTVIRGTFNLFPDGHTEIADEQTPVCKIPEHFGDPAASSLKYDQDLTLNKPRTDVIVHAQAYAPYGEPSVRVRVELELGPIKKALDVYGDRQWTWESAGRGVSVAEKFTTMPITWERAYGGADESDAKQSWDLRNPIGTGYARQATRRIGMPAPNVVTVGGSLTNPSGFGPVARHWMPRRSYAGTYDAKWEESRAPLLPTDYDARFEQCAPENQQAKLRGGERVRIKNMTPDGLLEFTLPKERFVSRSLFGKQLRSIEHRASLATVIIEPEEMRLQMVWQSQLECHAHAYQLRKTITRTKRYI
ncbi:MAG: DUF2169 family type VI secretion system accessory protein [Nannocystaceae bacterium]